MQNNLKAIRKKRTSMTQEAAAAGLHMNLETYRKWEQGKVNLTAAQLKTLADFYGCTIDEICATDFDAANRQVARDVWFQGEIDELNICYFKMDDNARELLMEFAHNLQERFPRED